MESGKPPKKIECDFGEDSNSVLAWNSKDGKWVTVGKILPMKYEPCTCPVCKESFPEEYVKDYEVYPAIPSDVPPDCRSASDIQKMSNQFMSAKLAKFAKLYGGPIKSFQEEQAELMEAIAMQTLHDAAQDALSKMTDDTFAKFATDKLDKGGSSDLNGPKAFTYPFEPVTGPQTIKYPFEPMKPITSRNQVLAILYWLCEPWGLHASAVTDLTHKAFACNIEDPETKAGIGFFIYYNVEETQQGLVDQAEYAISELIANEGSKMALTAKINGLAAIKKIGIQQSLYDWFTSNNGKVEYVGTGLKFTVTGLDPALIPMTLAHVQQINLGTILHTKKVEYRILIQAAIQGLMVKKAKSAVVNLEAEFEMVDPVVLTAKDYGLPVINPAFIPPLVPIEGVTGADMKSKISSAKPSWVSKPSAYLFNTTDGPAPPKAINVIQAHGFPVYPLDEIYTADLVPLWSADRMYQPVSASTPGKRYYVVALCKALRIAAKYHSNELSVRIEGPLLEENVKTLVKVFPNASTGKNYCSLHLSCSDEEIASRALGAILMGSGVDWETPLPKLELIKNK